MYQIKHPHVNCPICKQSDQVLLLEELYFGLIEKDQSILSKLQPTLQTKTLLTQIQPPSLDRLPFWLITPPDYHFLALVVVVILIFILTNTTLSLGTGIMPIIVIVVYLLYRKKLSFLHHQKQEERNAVIEKAQRAADDWSSYFICLDDMTVFSGHFENHFSVSELKDKLN
jgi:hypothetical protein